MKAKTFEKIKMPDGEKHFLYGRAFKKGENLMPCDCAEIIGKRRFRKYGKEECVSVVIELMQRCNFYCDEEEAAIALDIF